MLGDMQHSEIRNAMESSRAAFVPLLLRLVDNPDFIRAISRPNAVGK
jgi:mediator of RNA polymerase II transcription subunit 5